jgi:DNA end-binding protein Ku
VPLASVDPVYFERTYYLAPDRGGSKPYTLLVTALRETSQCAIGRWAARGREHIVVIRPIEKGLAMHQLHFQAEVRAIGDLGIEPAEVSEAELKLARQLIGQQTSEVFDAASYVDEFKGRVEAAIQKKVEGKQISLSDKPAAKAPGNVIDLMDMLRASLESRGSSDLKARKPPKRAGKPAPARSGATKSGAAKSAPARKSSRG